MRRVTYVLHLGEKGNTFRDLVGKEGNWKS
jgi:hypothetical protein